MRKPPLPESLRVGLLALFGLLVPVLAGAVLWQQAHVPLLGVYVDDASPPIVSELMPGSAAAAAGLRPGDAILAVDGRSYADWPLADRRLGDSYDFDLVRDGKPLAVSVTLSPMLQANLLAVLSAMFAALVFWATGLLLLRRGWRQVHVVLLFLLFQACGAALLPGLTYPRFWLPRHWMLSLATASLIFAAPLLLHYHLTFPVHLGHRRRRRWLLGVLYAAALAAALDAWQRPDPWRSPALWGALALGGAAIAVSLHVYFRRATADGRRRLRTVTAGTVVGSLPALAYLVSMAARGYSPAVPRWSLSLSVAILPLSYLYATVRQDLFRFDRLLNRAMVYATLSLTILAFSLGAVYLIYRVAPGGWLLHGALVCALTLLVAVTFQEARTRVQHWVDRLFYGGWYDYGRVVEQASAALARSRSWDDAAAILTADVPATMQLRGARLATGSRSTPALDLARWPEGDSALARLELPLDCGGQACGTWTLAPRRDGEDFSSEDRRILQTVAREAEIALSNVLLVETLRSQLDELRASRKTLLQLQQQLLRSREEERGRLARDLHDGPIQTLVAMNMQLGMIEAAAGTAGSGALTPAELLGMRAEVRELLGELRRACTELRPPTLDTLGLGAALRALAADWSAQNGVAVSLALAADESLRSLPEEVVVNLYRVAQEALSNAAQHAAAQHVELRLDWQAEDGRLELAVRDDGRGFIPAAVEELASQGHFGLAGIGERAALIGGRWDIQSTPGLGAVVCVAWPANGAPAPRT